MIRPGSILFRRPRGLRAIALTFPRRRGAGGGSKKAESSAEGYCLDRNPRPTFSRGRRSAAPLTRRAVGFIGRAARRLRRRRGLVDQIEDLRPIGRQVVEIRRRRRPGATISRPGLAQRAAARATAHCVRNGSLSPSPRMIDPLDAVGDRDRRLVGIRRRTWHAAGAALVGFQRRVCTVSSAGPPRLPRSTAAQNAKPSRLRPSSMKARHTDKTVSMPSPMIRLRGSAQGASSI
jgi:hypothetical protein